jgi:hypothetical protein
MIKFEVQPLSEMPERPFHTTRTRHQSGLSLACRSLASDQAIFVACEPPETLVHAQNRIAATVKKFGCNTRQDPTRNGVWVYLRNGTGGAA